MPFDGNGWCKTTEQQYPVKCERSGGGKACQVGVETANTVEICKGLCNKNPNCTAIGYAPVKDGVQVAIQGRCKLYQEAANDELTGVRFYPGVTCYKFKGQTSET